MVRLGYGLPVTHGPPSPGEHVGDAVGVAVAVTVGVGVGLCATAQYLPPVLRGTRPLPSPPQTIISLPVHNAVCWLLTSGAPVTVVAAKVSLAGLYLPPVFKSTVPLYPPQTIISVPVHTAV